MVWRREAVDRPSGVNVSISFSIYRYEVGQTECRIDCEPINK